MKASEIITKYLKGLQTETKGFVILTPVNHDNLVEIVSSLHKVYELPLLTIKAADERKNGKGFAIYYVFGVPKSKYTIVLKFDLEKKTSFPSIIKVMHEASLYEQEIQTFFGLTPEGHPFAHPIILHENWPNDLFPLRKDFPWDKKVTIDKHDAQVEPRVTGEGIYQIPVGPIHAGIIEPGHFIFSVIGERILSLQAKLGYVHKGSEKLFEVMPLEKQVKLSEHISGDTSFSHSLAFCQALEDISGTTISSYAKYLRVIYSELERMANHINDIGFILNDTAYAFGGSNGMRLREQIMQINEDLTGSRFLRGINVPGGVTKVMPEGLLNNLVSRLQAIVYDFGEFVEIAQDSETVMNRLKGTGILNHEIAKDHGVVGMAARMVGFSKDARVQYPYAGYEKIETKMHLQHSGDVYARYQLRIDEVYESMRIIKEAVELLKKEKPVLTVELKNFAKNAIAVGITEGWRGEIVYLVMTDQDGKITRVGVRDPSFLNWPAVTYAVEENIVPDFPLINKSFNLSYSGFDR